MAAAEGTGLLEGTTFCSHHTPTTSSSSSNETSNNTGLQFSISTQQCNVCGTPVSGRKASWSSSSSLTNDVIPKRGNSRKITGNNYDAISQGSWLQRLAQAWNCRCCANDVAYTSPQVASRLNEARMFSFKELSRATNAFAQKNQLGEGGFGHVYKGVLPDGVQIAAKKMAANSSQGLREFVSELRTVGRIGRLQHKHLVPLLGWCQHNGQMILVYEYMPGGSLDKVLHKRKQPVEDTGAANPLTWAQRLSILKGVASALSFLHRGWLHGVVHRDVKSSNILLDKDMTAKLGDFGLAQQFNHGKVALATPHAGTKGYLAPEALSSTGIICDKLDVYSFGALALEVACGRPPVDVSLPSDQVVLLEWVWKLKEADRLKDAIDTRLGGDFDEGEMVRVITVGLLCVHLAPQQRPSMVQVEAMLAGKMALPTLPKSRPRMSFISGFSNLETGAVAGFALPLPPPPNCRIEPGIDQSKGVGLPPLAEHS